MQKLLSITASREHTTAYKDQTYSAKKLERMHEIAQSDGVEAAYQFLIDIKNNLDVVDALVPENNLDSYLQERKIEIIRLLSQYDPLSDVTETSIKIVKHASEANTFHVKTNETNRFIINCRG